MCGVVKGWECAKSKGWDCVRSEGDPELQDGRIVG